MADIISTGSFSKVEFKLRQRPPIMAEVFDDLASRKASVHFDSLAAEEVFVEDEEIDYPFNGSRQPQERKFTISDVNPHISSKDYYEERNHTIARHHNRTRTYSAVSRIRMHYGVHS